MVIEPAAATLGASQSHEAEQFSVRPAAVHAAAFAACRRSTDGLVVNGYRSLNKSTATIAEDATTLNINE